MTTQYKGVLAGLAALAIAGAAFAQGNPPNPAVKDPAVGAGQQSTKTTPMGTTGTPAGSGAAVGTTSSATTGTTSSTAAAAPAASTDASSSSSSTSMGASGSSSMTAADTAAGPTTRKGRADRN